MSSSVAESTPAPAGLKPALTRIFRDDCHRRDAAELAGNLVALFDVDGPRSARARRLLVESGVRDQWNHALGAERSRVLADELTPLLQSRVADVLSGDGTLARAISSHEDKIVAYERTGAYPTRPVYPTLPFDEFANVVPGEYETLLVSTVLHHEDDLDPLLDLLARAKARRWVVVENCITENAPVDLHEFVDLVFNHTLNDFEVSCPTQHRDIAGWTAVLERFGTVRLHTQLLTVPGIPFSYEIFVVETR